MTGQAGQCLLLYSSGDWRLAIGITERHEIRQREGGHQQTTRFEEARFGDWTFQFSHRLTRTVARDRV